MNRIKIVTYFLIAFPALIAFYFQKIENKQKIRLDLQRNESIAGKTGGPEIYRLYYRLVTSREFRSIYYMRLGKLSRVISFLMPGVPMCGIGATKSEYVGGGVYIQHGWSMVLDAESVGENLWINQNVTVGYRGNGHPKIGNNVRIGTGAVVLGPITIGDNVNIGANAIVVDDVPSDVTICSPKAVIVKKHIKS